MQIILMYIHLIDNSNLISIEFYNHSSLPKTSEILVKCVNGVHGVTKVCHLRNEGHKIECDMVK